MLISMNAIQITWEIDSVILRGRWGRNWSSGCLTEWAELLFGGLNVWKEGWTTCFRGWSYLASRCYPRSCRKYWCEHPILFLNISRSLEETLYPSKYCSSPLQKWMAQGCRSICFELVRDMCYNHLEMLFFIGQKLSLLSDIMLAQMVLLHPS